MGLPEGTPCSSHFFIALLCLAGLGYLYDLYVICSTKHIYCIYIYIFIVITIVFSKQRDVFTDRTLSSEFSNCDFLLVKPRPEMT